MVTFHDVQFIDSVTIGGKPVFRYRKEGSCLSADSKPTGSDIYNGSELIEMDTGKGYLYDAQNSTWREV